MNFWEFISSNILWILIFSGGVMGILNVFFKGMRSLFIDPWFRGIEARRKLVIEEYKTEELRAQNLDKELALTQLKLKVLDRTQENLLYGNALDKSEESTSESSY